MRITLRPGGVPVKPPPGNGVARGRRSSEQLSFRDFAQTRNRYLAQHMANVLFYPADVAAQVPDAAWPVREALALVGAMLPGAALVFLATHLRLARRARLQAIAQPA